MPSVDVSIQAGNGDAAYDGESWVSNGTTLAITAASSAWLQFPLTLPRNTAIQSATLTVTPSDTSLVVPNIGFVSFAPLFDGDLATDRSAMLASLEAETEAGFSAWTAGVAVALDVSEVLQSWIQNENVPGDDSGAFCTLVVRLDGADPSTYSMATFEHATLAPATLRIVTPARGSFPRIGVGVGIGI